MEALLLFLQLKKITSRLSNSWLMKALILKRKTSKYDFNIIEMVTLHFCCLQSWDIQRLSKCCLTMKQISKHNTRNVFLIMLGMEVLLLWWLLNLDMSLLSKVWLAEEVTLKQKTSKRIHLWKGWIYQSYFGCLQWTYRSC